MESLKKKPHAVCVPLPAQGHMNPMLKLAKLLHSQGFHVTFVLTEFKYQRLQKSRGLDSLKMFDDFQFETISDGLPPTNQRGILDLPALCRFLPVHSLLSFRELVVKLKASSEVPPITCIVSDGAMSFTLEVAEEFGIPEVLFFTHSACGMLGYLQFEKLIQRGHFPLKDESCLSNGYLDTPIDWVPALDGVRLKDLPTFLRTTDPNDTMFNYNVEAFNNALKAKSIILNTFEDLEQEVLDSIRTRFSQLYTIGPLWMLQQQFSQAKLDPIELNLWEEDRRCLDWLDKRECGSVVYVNYGSLVTLTPLQLNEFAWGLANSECPFLWVIRSNLVDIEEEMISNDFMEEIRGRGLLSGWCAQEKVLKHPAIGCFLTHCGWNSMLESIGQGVPMICWPFFAEQQLNCFFCCSKWGNGVEIESDVRREKVEETVRELMGGEKGREVKERAMERKKRAEKATNPGGSSYVNFDNLVKQLNGGINPL